MRPAGFGALLLALVAGATLAAQAPKDTLPEVVIQGGETALLRLEAVVTDKHGRPVTDLTSDDFVVYEEGQKQTISHFQAPAPRTAPAAAPSGEPLDAAPEEVVAEQRHIVLALDDLHLSPTSLAASKAAMKRFVDEQVSDEDEVAVVTTSGNLGLYQAFTQERFDLRRAIDRLSYNERRANAGGRATMSEYEAQAIDRGDREALRLAQRGDQPAGAGQHLGARRAVGSFSLATTMRPSARPGPRWPRPSRPRT